MDNVVYVVKTDWAYDGEGNSESTLFRNYKEAKQRFDKAVQDEKVCSWVENAIINNVVQEGYEFEEKEDYWEVWEEGYYAGTHTLIQVIKTEIY